MVDATDFVSHCDVGTREPAQEDAAAMATGGGVENWAESEQKSFFGYATGSECPRLRTCQCVCVNAHARVCVRVFSSGFFLKCQMFGGQAFQKSRQEFYLIVSIIQSAIF